MIINKKSIGLITVFTSLLLVCGFIPSKVVDQKFERIDDTKNKNQTINMFVTHGHCSTPFSGKVDELTLELEKRTDKGNSLENMKIAFEVDPNTFNVCSGKELTERIKTPGLFIGENEEKITFRTTTVYTVGLDWYQLNGYLSIKGVERNVKLFATEIREGNESQPTSIVLEGQLDLLDWGIDYDLIVNGKSDSIPTKWLYLNMRFQVN